MYRIFHYYICEITSFKAHINQVDRCCSNFVECPVHYRITVNDYHDNRYFNNYAIVFSVFNRLTKLFKTF